MESSLGRAEHRNAVGERRFGESVIVSDHSLKVVAKGERCSEMDGVERSQDGRVKEPGLVEDCGGHIEQCHRVEDLSRSYNMVRSCPTNGAQQLGPSQIARDGLTVRRSEPPLQGGGLGLRNYEFGQR